MAKKITKKEIAATLRSMDSTAVYRAYWLATGLRPQRNMVYRWIKENAPSKRVYNHADDIAMLYYRPEDRNTNEVRNAIRFFHENPRAMVVARLRRELARPLDRYTKVPKVIDGYFCFISPFHEHDYNETFMGIYEQDSEFFDKVCRVAGRYLANNITIKKNNN